MGAVCPKVVVIEAVTGGDVRMVVWVNDEQGKGVY